MRTWLVVGGLVVACGTAWADYVPQYVGQQQAQGLVGVNDQEQSQSQAQATHQDQTGIVQDGDTIVNNPRQHRNTPSVAVQTAPGQSGFGVSFPGGSFTGVRTDVVDRAQKYIALCNRDQKLTCDRQRAADQALKSLDSCYLAGPVGDWLGRIVRFISFKQINLDLENDGGPFCF